MPYDIQTRRGRVDAWSTQRLPPEPKRWLRELRDDIRKALRKLDNSDALYARYSSQSRDRCDVENVLFYNVGPSSFSRLSTRRLAFERSFETPGGVWPHHSLYSNEPAPRRVWRRSQERAVFETELAPQGAPPPRLDTSFSWAAMQRAPALSSNGTIAGHYGLSVTIDAPPGTHLVLASALKGIFDGVISAFHCHDGRDLEAVSARLGAILFEDPLAVARHLSDDAHAVLGPTRLLRKYRAAGVQWSPADDRCVAGELARTDSTGAWKLSGSLYEVEAA